MLKDHNDTTLPSAYGAALLSPSRARTGEASPVHGDALDATFDKLALAIRLFLEPGDAAAPHLVVGEFRVVHRLGIGGMGSVYGADSPKLQRRVALKKLTAISDDPERVPQLLHEARCMAKVKHPNVVAIHDLATVPWHVVDPEALVGPCPSGTTSIIVMEHLEGDSFRDWLRAGKRTWRESVAVLLQAARGLNAAHEQGLLHGDLTLNNIVVTRAGVAKLVDFGLARQEAGGAGTSGSAPRIELTEICGTPGYVAPEQLMPGMIDARTDLFSLCVIGWEAVCGVRPYPDGSLTPGTLPTAAPPPRPAREAWPDSAPGWLRDLLLRGLELDREARPASVRALIGELERRLERRRGAWVPWSLAALASAAMVVAMNRGPDFPGPLATDDPGLAGMLDAERMAGLGALEAVAPGLPERIEQFRGRWEEVRVAARSFVDPELRERAALCLTVRREHLGQVLAAIEATRAVNRDVARRWFAELEPPEACGDEADLRQERLGLRGVAAVLVGDEAAMAYDRGVARLLRDDPGGARHELLAARAGTRDPLLRGQASRRLAELAIEGGELARADAYLTEARRDLAEDDVLAVHVDKLQAHVAQHREDPREVLAVSRTAMARLHRPGRTRVRISENEADLALQGAWAMTRLHGRGEVVACPIACDGCDALACAGGLVGVAEQATPAAPEPRARLHYAKAELARARGDKATALREALAAKKLDGDAGQPSARTVAILALVARLWMDAGNDRAAEVELRAALRVQAARGGVGSALGLQIYDLLFAVVDPVTVRALGGELEPALAAARLPEDAPRVIELYAALAEAWLAKPSPSPARALALAERGVWLANRERRRLTLRARTFAAHLHVMAADAAASLQSGVGSAHLQAAREWLPGAADLAGDPELREFADDVRESLERGAGAVKKGD